MAHSTVSDDQSSDAEKTQQDNLDANTAHAEQPRNPEREMVSEMESTADANIEQAEQANNPQEQHKQEESNAAATTEQAEQPNSTEEEKGGLSPGLALDTCMQPPCTGNFIICWGNI